MTAPAFAFEANAVFNESDSFVIAKSVKLGYGDGSRQASPMTSAQKEVCSSNSNCLPSQMCKDGKCAKLCTGSGSNYQIDHKWCLSCPSVDGCKHSDVSGTHKCCTSCKPGYTLMGSNSACIKNSSTSASRPQVCRWHDECPEGHECTEGGYSCRKCAIGSNLGQNHVGSCNCPSGTYSDGKGHCSSEICQYGKKKEYNHRTGTYECPRY